MTDLFELKSKGNLKLKMSFEYQFRSLPFFHLEEEHMAAQHLLQTLKEDDFSRELISSEDGNEKAAFRKLSTT